MLVVGFTFFDQPVENAFHIRLHVGVGILVDAESGAGVLHKQVQQTGLRQWWQLAHHFVRHQMETTSVGCERKLLLYDIEAMVSYFDSDFRQRYTISFAFAGIWSIFVSSFITLSKQTI